MTSIALSPGIPLPIVPHVHSDCCGHHHKKHSDQDKERPAKQDKTSELGFLAELWRRILKWIWGGSKTKIKEAPDLLTLNEKQQHLAQAPKAREIASVPTRLASLKPHQSNSSTHHCSGSSCAISHK